MPNPSNKFKFVSPGVFITEIDNSQLPALPERIGPLVIGRAEKGPGMVPVRVESFSEYVETHFLAAKTLTLGAKEITVRQHMLAMQPNHGYVIIPH